MLNEKDPLQREMWGKEEVGEERERERDREKKKREM